MANSLSVVFPMFNEKEYIRDTVALALNALEDITEDYEIIIVDDASFDGSEKIADELSQQNPRIKIVHNRENRKLGGSLKAGFNVASKDYVLYSDIDMPFAFEEIKKAINYLSSQEADFVSVYRINKRVDGLKRYIYSIVYNNFIRGLFGLNIRDINFSFKIFKVNLLRALDLCSESSFIDAEMLIKARRRKAKIIQFGTIYFPRRNGASRLSSPGVILAILREAFLFRFGLLSQK